MAVGSDNSATGVLTQLRFIDEQDSEVDNNTISIISSWLSVLQQV